MTGLAARGSIRPSLLHTLLELPFVRIGVAASAVQATPVINHRGLRLELGGLLVAVRARNCDMPAGQVESRLLVLR